MKIRSISTSQHTHLSEKWAKARYSIYTQWNLPHPRNYSSDARVVAGTLFLPYASQPTIPTLYKSQLPLDLVTSKEENLILWPLPSPFCHFMAACDDDKFTHVDLGKIL